MVVLLLKDGNLTLESHDQCLSRILMVRVIGAKIEIFFSFFIRFFLLVFQGCLMPARTHNSKTALLQMATHHNMD